MTAVEFPRVVSRVMLFDAAGRVVLIRRTRPGQESYLTTPGGGVHEGETGEAAAARECAEELGAEITVGPVAFVDYVTEPWSAVHSFYLARLDAIDASARTGHEFSEPERGGYETVHLETADAQGLATLRPAGLSAVLVDFGEYLGRKAAALP